MKRIAVVGVGMMGASLARAIKQHGQAQHIIGIDPNPEHAAIAQRLGIVDELATQVPDDVELIALCMPSDLVAQHVVQLRAHPATVIDLGSVKGHMVAAVTEQLGALPDNYVPCHPIIGSEKSCSTI